MAMLFMALTLLSAQDPPPLRVMSYNVRVGSAKDGENHWDKRKDLCAARAVAFKPDLLGLQEALEFQNDFLREKLGGYAQVGVARDDGGRKGEFSTVLYRKERFEEAESGTFWLSETPDAPGSKSWDSAFPRIATWARLRDRAAGGRELLFVNTHFDHKGVQARAEAAKRLRAFLEKRGGPVVLTGDFNAGPDSEAYATLAEKLTDTWRALKPEIRDGTYHPFNGVSPTKRIDWIFCSSDFAVKEADIDRFHENGRYPSDHFPVTAVLAWKPTDK